MIGRRYWICIVLVLVLVILNLPLPLALRVKFLARDNMAPFQTLRQALVQRGSDGLACIFSSRRVLEEREVLLQEIGELRERVRTLEGLETENELLRRQAVFANRSPRKLILAEVIGRDDMTGWWQSVRLNKGRDDGIWPDMAVITIDGLVGRTTDVSRHTTEVLLVTDPNCRVSCRFSRTGAFGVVRGGGRSAGRQTGLDMLCVPEPCRMDFVAAGEDIWPHDAVVTSGLGGVFPEGLLVGDVAGSRLDASGLFQCADILPAADIGNLRYVFVVAHAEGDADSRSGRREMGATAASPAVGRPGVEGRARP